MEKWRVLIADDDENSRFILRSFIELIPDLIIVGEASTGKELVEIAMEQKPEIVLVDIDMPVINGLEAVQICKELLPYLNVIFTTGHDEFAVEAFNISAVDYMVKPINRTRLALGLDKVRKNLLLQKQVEKNTMSPLKRLSLKTNNFYLYLPMEDILFVEKVGRKTLIHTQTNSYETNESLQVIEAKLDSSFYKTHRSYIVNLKHIIKIEGMGESYMVHFSGCNKTSQISKLKIHEVQELLSKIIAS
jgi:two-component system LytT family response regulator